MRNSVLADQIGRIIAGLLGLAAGSYVLYLLVAIVSSSITVLPNTGKEALAWGGCAVALAALGVVSGFISERRNSPPRPPDIRYPL